MFGLTKESIERPKDLRDGDDPAVLHAISMLTIRALVGVLGIVLPIVFIVGEAFYLEGSVQVRGSISAYYHTTMRDAFVGALTVIGFLLATYLVGRFASEEFWDSLLAGVALVGVVVFPTMRPNLADTAPRCGVDPAPAGCAPIQQALGETLVATVHYVCAVIFILSLARICWPFADRERRYLNNRRTEATIRACAFVILLSIVWIGVGGLLDLDIWGLTPLYVGEVASVWAFGVAWIIKSRDLTKAIGPRRIAPA